MIFYKRINFLQAFQLCSFFHKELLSELEASLPASLEGAKVPFLALSTEMSWLAIDGQVIPYGSIISRFAAGDADAVPRCSSWFLWIQWVFFRMEMRRSKIIFF